MPEGVDHSAFTWDPVTATWVHERGPEIAPPPPPPDVHSLQTYFFEPDSKQWIRTVLADRGRELAAQFRGAHRIPTEGAVPAVKGKLEKRKSSPTPVIAAFVVLLLLAGGAAVFASQSGLLGGTVAAPLASLVPGGSIAPTVAPSAVAASPSGPPSPSPTATTGGGGGGGGAPPPRTAPPATLSLPPGLSTRLPNGTAVIYTGPTLVVKPQALGAQLTVTMANGQPASGPITVSLSTVSANATIDGNGRVVVTLATTSLAPGAYPLTVIYQGTFATVTQITVR